MECSGAVSGMPHRGAIENGAAEEGGDAAVSVGDDGIAGARSAREAEARRRCDDTAVGDDKGGRAGGIVGDAGAAQHQVRRLARRAEGEGLRPALKVKPPRVAGPEKVMAGRPAAPKKAVPVGTVFGDQLAALLKLAVTPFQVASCARTPAARPRSHSSRAAQGAAT
jgi:hypothetical protein